VQVFAPGVEVTVYPVIAAPPSLVGAAHVTVTLPSPATPLTPVGAPGAVAALRVKFAAGPNPSEFRALTRTLYDFVDTRLGIVNDVAVEAL